MTEKEIFSYIKGLGFNEYATAGIMGNIQAESALRSDNVEDRSGISDKTYTDGVDNGTYQRFVNDAFGYGLCQWTYPPRKQALLAYAKQRGVSISDAQMQIDFLLKELTTDYRQCYNVLKSAQTVSEASDAFLLQFERPANAEGQRTYRASLGRAIFDRCKGAEAAQIEVEIVNDRKYPADLSTLSRGFYGSQVKAVQALLSTFGYIVDVNSVFDEQTEQAVMDFQRDYGLGVDGIVGKNTLNILLGGG